MGTSTGPQPPLAELVDLSNKTAIVTGGAAGIGRAIAARLHEAGASVVIADMQQDAAQATAEQLAEVRPGSAVAVRVDVGNATDVQAAVDTAVARFGRLDVLVNNAGIYPVAPFAELTEELLQRVLTTNLVGAFLMMKAASAQMISQGGGGRIINVTSVDALHPSAVGMAAYDASKHGLWGLTKNVALELAEHGIAVNALAPGAVATPGVSASAPAMEGSDEVLAANALHRMADPDELGRAALFLASGLASYMIGSQVVVDAGMLLL